MRKDIKGNNNRSITNNINNNNYNNNNTNNNNTNSIIQKQATQATNMTIYILETNHNNFINTHLYNQYIKSNQVIHSTTTQSQDHITHQVCNKLHKFNRIKISKIISEISIRILLVIQQLLVILLLFYNNKNNKYKFFNKDNR